MSGLSKAPTPYMCPKECVAKLDISILNDNYSRVENKQHDIWWWSFFRWKKGWIIQPNHHMECMTFMQTHITYSWGTKKCSNFSKQKNNGSWQESDTIALFFMGESSSFQTQISLSIPTFSRGIVLIEVAVNTNNSLFCDNRSVGVVHHDLSLIIDSRYALLSMNTRHHYSYR